MTKPNIHLRRSTSQRCEFTANNHPVSKSLGQKQKGSHKRFPAKCTHLSEGRIEIKTLRTNSSRWLFPKSHTEEDTHSTITKYVTFNKTNLQQVSAQIDNEATWSPASSRFSIWRRTDIWLSPCFGYLRSHYTFAFWVFPVTSQRLFLSALCVEQLSTLVGGGGGGGVGGRGR